MENMLLLATDMGLGSLWCGIFPIESRMQQVRDILRMPQNVNPLGLMYVGYPVKKQGWIDFYLYELVLSELEKTHTEIKS